MTEPTITEDGVSPEKLAKVMQQINLLLARADHPTTPIPEAELSRERAERLMFRYRVAEASLDSETKAKMGIKPMKATWWVAPAGSEFSMQYRQMAAYVVHHVGAYAVSRYDRKMEDGVETGWTNFDVYGFESDLRYGELLWNSIRIAFKSLLEPKLDRNLSDMNNVFAMRNAGMERIRIAEIMGYGLSGSATSKVTRLYKKACAEKGEDAATLLGKGNNVKTFRRSYADSFGEEIWQRLYRLRTAVGLNSHELVLANRMDEIMEMLYIDHPNLRPRPMDPNAPVMKFRKQRARKFVERPVNYAAQDRGRAAANRVDLGPLAKERRLP